MGMGLAVRELLCSDGVHERKKEMWEGESLTFIVSFPRDDDNEWS